jgi:arylsulfatase A-like enzyme
VTGFLLSFALLAADRPNVLWITCEDMSPNLGCYGDKVARTPNIDRFAKESLKYRFVWSNAPVCAPARTALISGMFPTSTGSEHMRSMAKLPAGMKFFPQYLRDAGYYCTNNVKEDYNLEKPGKVWDESSKRAHWNNRKPGQPFFAVFNSTTTHESQIRDKTRKLVTDPAAIRLPPYHPDLPAIRRDWAKYYDNIALMDAEFGKRLAELDASPEAENTIVFFFSDHGSGMPRSKRSACDSGLHVPMLVRIPPKWKHLAPDDYQPGGETSRLVQFVDFGPTVLSLANVATPTHMQGVAFMGSHRGEPNRFLHGFRGRMDERYDMVRSVTDGRYVYVRNYAPHRPSGKHNAYMFITETTRVWHEEFKKGSLNDVQAAFWKPRAAEELYDLLADQRQSINVAGSPQHVKVLDRLRHAQKSHALAIRDVGFLPEDEMRRRSAKSTPFEYAHSAEYQLERILDAANQATDQKTPIDQLTSDLRNRDSAVRYWSAIGLLIRANQKKIPSAIPRFVADVLTKEATPSVQIVLAEFLGSRDATQEIAKSTLWKLVRDPNQNYFAVVAALNALDYLNAGPPDVETAAVLRQHAAKADGRTREYIARLTESLAGR